MRYFRNIEDLIIRITGDVFEASTLWMLNDDDKLVPVDDDRYYQLPFELWRDKFVEV